MTATNTNDAPAHERLGQHFWTVAAAVGESAEYSMEARVAMDNIARLSADLGRELAQSVGRGEDAPDRVDESSALFHAIADAFHDAKRLDYDQPVPVPNWGRDHWAMFAYVESICVDGMEGIGVPDRAKVRCHAGRHPGLLSVDPMMGTPRDGSKWPIRLAGGAVLYDYDEWDCIYDAEKVGFIEDVGTGIAPLFKMTPAGMAAAAALRSHKADGGSFATFSYEPPDEPEQPIPGLHADGTEGDVPGGDDYVWDEDGGYVYHYEGPDILPHISALLGRSAPAWSTLDPEEQRAVLSMAAGSRRWRSHGEIYDYRIQEWLDLTPGLADKFEFD